MIWGTLYNMAAVALGGWIGWKLSKWVPEDLRDHLMKVLGIFNIYLGLSMALKSQMPLIVLFSLLIGGTLGYAFKLSQQLQQWTSRLSRGRSATFSEGLSQAFILYCVGSMTILGALEEGGGQFPTLLLTKGTMDGIAAIPLTVSWGPGVIASIIPMFFYQAGLTLGAGWLLPWISVSAMAELTACGGIMIIGIGGYLLGILRIPWIQFLPALPMACVLDWFWQHYR